MRCRPAEQKTDFLAFLREAISSRSFADSRLRASCRRRSAAVMRTTMSGNGLSRILTVLIFGGLE